ncbi:hypothetical protein LS482_00690 [Sinomicrobium kalidii]|uniref:hypothetical protein n=1 Tax=Sinomicrobium kalidii TaxID=2900738 RepID=UPI001E550042|nr:hypothetical protein [Sinomicrobium kalidii]UGU16400.1 hypothetical protein LS482_00690 [Sinomicrobium kalidii]
MGFFEVREMLDHDRVKEYEDMMEQVKGEAPMSRKGKDALPVVNSPRISVCGYEGGTIDTKGEGTLKII